MKVELQGKVIRIGKTQTFGSGFQKREIVIECGDDRFANPIPVEATKDKCEHLDKFNTGEVVEVSGYLNGNYWESGDRYFLALRMAYIKHAEGHKEPTEPETKHSPPPQQDLDYAGEEVEEPPF
jgi:hypothetical protein